MVIEPELEEVDPSHIICSLCFSKLRMDPICKPKETKKFYQYILINTVSVE